MILYKYYPCNEYTFRALSEMGLWCSPASNMNDPFDCLGQLMKDDIVTIKDLLSTHVANDKLIIESQSIKKNYFFQTCRYIIDNFSFCSFTNDPFNILMWSYYANAHTGIVIGIEIPIKYEKDVYKVEYQNEVPVIPIEYFASLIESDNTGYDIEKYRPILQYVSTKTEDWKHEKEWRFWGRDKSEYLPYGVENLNSVYFGLRCSKETIDKVKTILRGHGVSDSIYHNIRIETDPEIRLVI